MTKILIHFDFYVEKKDKLKGFNEEKVENFLKN